MSHYRLWLWGFVQTGPRGSWWVTELCVYDSRFLEFQPPIKWVYLYSNKRRESGDGDVTLKLWWIRNLVKIKIGHPSCVTYKKKCKVEPQESLKKHTRIRKQLPKPSLWTQDKPCLTNRIGGRRTSEWQNPWLGVFWIRLGGKWALSWDTIWRGWMWHFVVTLERQQSGLCVYFQRNKKRWGSGKGKCHLKTMMNTKANERIKWTLNMCRLVRTWRKKYEGNWKRRGTTRKTTSQRYEWPRWKYKCLFIIRGKARAEEKAKDESVILLC